MRKATAAGMLLVASLFAALASAVERPRPIREVTVDQLRSNTEGYARVIGVSVKDHGANSLSPPRLPSI